MSRGILTTDSSPLLQVHDVSISYYLKGHNVFRPRRFEAVRGVTFDLYEGDSLGIIGRNGAGKSTLLSCIAGIIEPDKGKITLRPGASASLLSLNLAFIPYLSGRENVILGGMLQGYSRRAMLKKMDAVQEFAELGDFFDEPLVTYSQGMRARLSFAVAFQIDPTILLVDEVLGVGDAEFQRKSTTIMKDRITAHSSTVVLVSHSPATIRELCNQALWLDDGCIQAYGEVNEVMGKYLDALTFTEAEQKVTAGHAMEPIITKFEWDGVDRVTMAYSWKVDNEPPRDLNCISFMHFCNGRLAKSSTGIALTHSSQLSPPLARWEAGRHYEMEPFTLTIGPDVAAGDYAIQVGLYDAPQGRGPSLQKNPGHCFLFAGHLTIVRDGDRIEHVGIRWNR